MWRKVILPRFTLVFAIATAILQANSALASGNLLCDAGFEQSEPNGGFPNSGCWLKNIDDYSDAGCAAFSARTGGNGIFQYTGFAIDQRQSQVYQDLPGAAGRRYFASAWVSTGFDGSWWLDGSRALVKVEFLDSAKNPLTEYTSSDVKAVNTGWTLLSFATNGAPARTSFVRFSLLLEKPQIMGLSFAGFDDCIMREIECADCIRLDEIPACPGSTGQMLKGSVVGVSPDDYKVGVYIFVEDWWPKPTFANPWTDIDSDGSWQCDIGTSIYDLNATELMAFLVPKNEITDWPVDFNNTVGLSAIPREAFRFPSVGSFRPSCFKKIRFADYYWLVKNNGVRTVGPGPNLFDSNNAWVDDSNQLHLKITNEGGQWRCAEVFTEASLGGGTYSFVVDSNTVSLDPSVVLGLFTWDEFAPHYANREMDVEISRWGNPFADNSQYAVQPADKSDHLHRFNTDPCNIDSITHVLDWGFGVAGFESFYGQTPPADQAGLIDSWVYTGNDVPRSGTENVRINLWLNQGNPPTDGNEAEVVIRDFEVSPCYYEVSPTALDFGSALISKATTKPVTIVNTGQCIPYTVVVDVNGPDANYFHVADRAFSLEPGSSKQIDVTFIPDTNRVYEAALEIISSTGVVSVPLTGRGGQIEYTRVSAIGSTGFLEGKVAGVDFSDYRVVSYVYVFDKWYIKPLCVSNKRATNPLVQIDNDGSWKCDIDVEWTDKAATQVASFLMPRNADYPPCILDSLDDPQMSQYIRVSADRPKLAISNVIAKPGNIPGKDSIVIDGWYFITMSEVLSAQQLCISIRQADKVIWTLCLAFEPDKFMNRGEFTYNKNGVSIKFDNQYQLLNSYAGKLRVTLSKADLTCLCSPITLAVGLGDFSQSATADEELDANIINGKKIIPIKFLSGCTNAVRIDKVTAKRDYMAINGAIVFKDTPPQLTMEDVSFGWGSKTFNVPAGNFVRTSRTQPKYRCRKFRTPDNGVVNAFFDFNAGSFWVKISGTKLDAESDATVFNIAMTGFSEGVSVERGR